MTTPQPDWELIANLGDRDPITHGGVFVYRDRTGTYPEECEILEPSHDGRSWTIHRFALERCTFEGGILSDNAFHPECDAWFADSLDATAACFGRDVAELRADFCSTDPLERADAYRIIGEYHGWLNLDEYPITIRGRKAIRARYPELASL